MLFWGIETGDAFRCVKGFAASRSNGWYLVKRPLYFERMLSLRGARGGGISRRAARKRGGLAIKKRLLILIFGPAKCLFRDGPKMGHST